MTKLPNGHWKISNRQRPLPRRPRGRRRRRACAPATRPRRSGRSPTSPTATPPSPTPPPQQVLDVRDGTLVQSAPAGGQTQLWELRPTYFLGNDSSLQSKAEDDRVFANNPNAPWWHDGYLPGQDLLQIFKNNGLNMVRVRPASINTTVVHDGVSFPITAAPYNNYTLAPPPASQIIPASANPASPGGTSSGNHAQTDWSADRPGQARQAARHGGQRDAVLLGRQHGRDARQLGGQDRRRDRGRPAARCTTTSSRRWSCSGRWARGRTSCRSATRSTPACSTRPAPAASRPSGTNCTPTADARRHGHGELLPAAPARGDAGDRRRGVGHVEPGAARPAAAAAADLHPRRRQPGPAALLLRRRADQAASRSTSPARATTPAGTAR